ncbi:MAG: T9SS type A sorting domain-containing protein [Candidatus Eisenbacteria bacterium]
MEQDVWQLYHASHPDQFILLGPDVLTSGPNGVTLQQFRINAGGLTFPLLRDCADGSTLSDSNLVKPYNQRDNYVVIDADGIIRYHADDFWDYGGRLHLNELYTAIQGALDDVLAVPTSPGARFALSVSPNPATRRVTFAFSAAPTSAHVRVLDLSGREVAAFETPASSAGPCPPVCTWCRPWPVASGSSAGS